MGLNGFWYGTDNATFKSAFKVWGTVCPKFRLGSMVLLGGETQLWVDVILARPNSWSGTLLSSGWSPLLFGAEL